MQSSAHVYPAMRIAAVLLAFAAVLFILIVGIFSTTLDPSTATRIGMLAVALCGLSALLLVIVAWLARRSQTSLRGPNDQTALLLTVLVSFVGAATLVFGTFHAVRFYVQRAVDQEAAVEPVSPSAF